ncbi:MAG: AAA family ATPase [Blastochloris sp.]|nr:AAA family ATPase [Blastochloris sp.]
MTVPTEADLLPPVIPHRQFEAVFREIERCREMTRRAGEAHCLSLEGPTGAGKTRLAQAYAAQHPPYETEAGSIQPVFYVDVPAQITVKGLSEHLLRYLGDPLLRGYTRQVDLDYRLDGLIRACVTHLVVLDDFHHLLNTDTSRRRDAVSDWLKVRIKNTRKPFLVISIEHRVQTILDHNPQLSRLFAARRTLEPFPYDRADTHFTEQLMEFDFFVRRAEYVTGARLTGELPRETLLARLHYATNGVVGNVMNLLTYAALLAQENRVIAVDLTLLSAAFESRMKDHLRDRLTFEAKVNPFHPHFALPAVLEW